MLLLPRYCFLALFRCDATILPDTLASMDQAHVSFLAICHFEHLHNNPVLRHAATVLAQGLNDRRARDVTAAADGGGGGDPVRRGIGGGRHGGGDAGIASGWSGHADALASRQGTTAPGGASSSAVLPGRSSAADPASTTQGPEQRRRTPALRARNRWQLAYTLVNNPAIVTTRRTRHDDRWW